MIKYIIALIGISIGTIAHADNLSASTPAVQMEQTASAPASVPQAIDDAISRVWNQSKPITSDTVLLPKIEQPTEKKVEIKATPITPPLARQQSLSVIAPTAKIISMPPKKERLTRQQTLQQEIKREKFALLTAQTRLVAAGKSGNRAAIQKYSNEVRERIQNLQALNASMLQ